MFPLAIVGGIVLAVLHEPNRLALSGLLTAGQKTTPGMLDSLSDFTMACCLIMGGALVLFIVFYPACSTMRGLMVAREEKARQMVGVIQTEKEALREARELENCAKKAKRSTARGKRL